MSDRVSLRSQRCLKPRLVLCLLFVAVTFFPASVTADTQRPQASATAQERIVVHSGVPMARVELATLRALFGMRLLEWPDGTPVRVFVMDSDSELHRRFTKEVLQMFPYQLRQAWDRLIFSGTGQAPREVGSIEEMLRRIIETPGAIGYLPAEELVEGISELEVAKQ